MPTGFCLHWCQSNGNGKPENWGAEKLKLMWMEWSASWEILGQAIKGTVESYRHLKLKGAVLWLGLPKKVFKMCKIHLKKK